MLAYHNLVQQAEKARNKVWASDNVILPTEIDAALLTKEERLLSGRGLPPLGRPSNPPDIRRRMSPLKPIAERDETEVELPQSLRARLRSM